MNSALAIATVDGNWYGPSVADVELSTEAAVFLDTAEAWLKEHGELLVLRRYSHAAGARDWRLVRTVEQLRAAPGGSPQTSVIVFRQPQLQVRGVAGPELLARAMTTVSDGTEWLVVRLERHERWGWSVDQAGETHAELREALEEEDLLGYEVAVGPFPPVLDTSDDVLEAIVPFPDGRTVRGIY